MKDLIHEFQLWKKLVLDHWRLFLIGGLLSGAGGYLYASLDVPMYTANTRFMLKNEGVGSLFGGQMSTLSGLLGGGQMGTPLERTAEIIASDRIVGKALLKDMTIGDTTDLVINHFIRLTDVRTLWEKDTALRNVQFAPTDRSIDELSLLQRKAFKIVKGMMIPEKGSGVVRKAFDKKSGVLTLTCVHRNEAFAIGLSRIIYDELGQFFIEQMATTSSNNAELVRRKVDSIQAELNAVRRSYAQQSDQSLGLLLQQDKVDLKALAVKEQMLNVMYAESMKNYEAYQFVSQAAMPSLTLIDAPYSPLNPILKNKVKYTILSFILSSIILIMAARIYFFINTPKEPRGAIS